MSQVIIVSNRLPVSVKKVDGILEFSASIGGLATGLSSYTTGKSSNWIGWPGITSDELTEDDKQHIVKELAKHSCSPIFLSKREIDLFYNGYSNALLWPLFHNLPYPDKNGAKHRQWWRAYRSVNKKYAEAVLNRAQPDSRIWVHDYQLLLTPQMIRDELHVPATIGFFLHIPVPDPKGFGKLAEHKKLLRGVSGADLIGMHTTGYVDTLLDDFASADIGTSGEGVLILENRVVRIADFPMGIDYDRYAEATKTKVVKAAVRRYQKRYKGLKIIAAVDRMDPSKGLAERLIAYRQLLEQNKRWRGKIVFSMIAAPSRSDIAAYKKLAKRLDTLVAEINGTYGTKRWQPVDYINTAQPFEEVAALFQVADVAFIAPLKDGMNLAAKEFIASNHGPGALVLSETAGAAQELQDALLVNPGRPGSLVDGLDKALHMPKRELKQRMKSMKQQLSENNVQSWAKSFVTTLQQPVPGTELRTKTITNKLVANIRNDYRDAKKRLILLDYDGSLVSFKDNYQDSAPSKGLLQRLQKLYEDPANTVVIVSGRGSQDLDAWFGKLPLNLISEHGASFKKSNNKRWQTTQTRSAAWKREIEPILQRYTELTPNARLEEKTHSLVWHYRTAPPYYAQKYAVTIKQTLKPLLRQYNLQIFQGNKILEVKDPLISKGNAIRYWLDQDHDFVLVLGDDYTDEDMFAEAAPTAHSIKVGRGRTNATYRLHHQSDVKSFLQALTR